jgi:hypothetical protein
MDRDSKLIFENYKQNIILEADEEEGWGWFLAKIVDPTGVLSYNDAAKAMETYAEKRDVPSLIMMVLALFCALPNFGLAAAGVGGIGWGAIKAGAKSAAKAGPKAALTFGEKLLQTISKTPGASAVVKKAIDSLQAQGLIKDPLITGILKEVFTTGSFTGAFKKEGSNALVKYGPKNVEKVMGSIPVASSMGAKAGFDKGIARGIYGPLAKTKLGARAATGLDTSGLLPKQWWNRDKKATQVPVAGNGTKENPTIIKFDNLQNTSGKDRNAYVGKTIQSKADGKWYKIVD